jgi:flagellar biosynthesis protein FlhA
MESLDRQSLLSSLKNSDVQFALAVIAIIFMMFIPLPSIVLDMLLSVSITLSFLTLLIAIYIKEPLEFSTFPTFLLLTTLFRLSLNIATTRNILLNGSKGHVSQVITAFGDFVVGGNYVVGFVIFLILIIINFLVITKGAGRVAEVSARFTLDAMPGKQMSIDADLNAGVIDREEAKKRRKKIENEADFYGSMDGASKFVRGDAIAGLIITAINIVVGLIIGVLQHDLSFQEAAQIYTLLTVGDGLVSQIPSIIISVSAGIVITRASGDLGLSSAMSEQMFLQPKALYLCTVLLFFMFFLPGIPKISFFILTVFFYFLARFAENELQKRHVKKQEKEQDDFKKEKRKDDSIESLLYIEPLTLEVGVGLIPLVDSSQNGEILDRIVSSRKQYAQEMGMIVPQVMVRDNIQLKQGEYQILLKGNQVAKGSLLMDHELAMSPEDVLDPIPGISTKEPAYGLDAIWIKTSQREEAAFRGYTVVNNSTVIVTHLTKIIQDYAHELIGRQEVQHLIESLKEKSPKVVEEVLSADGVSLGCVVKVLQNLLKESVSIKDLLTIFETIADYSKSTKNPDILTKHVRKALGRSIGKKYASQDSSIQVLSLDRATEDLIASGVSQNEDGSSYLSLDPEIARKFLHNLSESVPIFEKTGSVPILMCGSSIRWELRKLIQHFMSSVMVLSFEEIPQDIKIQTLKILKI